MARKLIAVPPDGMNLGTRASDQMAFYGIQPVPQRSTNMQQIVQGGPVMALMCYSANANGIANSTANNVASANVVMVGTAATDFVLGVSMQAAVANCALLDIGANIAASNITVNQFNPSTSTGGNGANLNWNAALLRGAPYATPTMANTGANANVIPANGGVEVVLTLAPTVTAIANATINAAGQLTAITMSNVGAGYWVPPTVVITSANQVTDDPIAAGGTGTANGAPILANYYAPTYGGLPPATGGSGASAVAVVANGNVTGCVITNPGSGYLAAPTISFIGGTYCAPGMMAQVNTLVPQANIGVTNVRVIGNNQIGVSFFNANTTVAANFTANNLRVFAFNEFPAISPLSVLTTSFANGANTSANTAVVSTAISAVGLTAANDLMVGCGFAAAAPAFTYITPGSVGAGNCTVMYSGLGGASNSLVANLNLVFYRTLCPAPLNVWAYYITPNANTVGASTTAEIVYTLPTGVALQANAPTIVNNLNPQANLFIGNVRANSASTLGITWVNASNATANVAGGWILIGNCQSILTVFAANQVGGYCTVPVSQTINQSIDNINDFQHALVNMGVIKGA